MNFRQLEYVITIYREGTLTKAAEKLFISQPALTQQLQKLEKEIGTQLFDRTTTPLTPTYAGKYYLDIMEKILYENQQALSWLEDIDSLNRGKIVLGISDIRSLQFLPVLLPVQHLYLLFRVRKTGSAVMRLSGKSIRTLKWKSKKHRHCHFLTW